METQGVASSFGEFKKRMVSASSSFVQGDLGLRLEHQPEEGGDREVGVQRENLQFLYLYCDYSFCVHGITQCLDYVCEDTLSSH